MFVEYQASDDIVPRPDGNMEYVVRLPSHGEDILMKDGRWFQPTHLELNTNVRPARLDKKVRFHFYNTLLLSYALGVMTSKLSESQLKGSI